MLLNLNISESDGEAALHKMSTSSSNIQLKSITNFQYFTLNMLE